MVNVFGQPARESAFLSAVKRIVSGVRNSFWQDVCPSSSLQHLFLYLHVYLQIWDSILPGNSQSSLEAFTVNTMHKYWPASLSETINSGYLIHNALLVSPVVIFGCAQRFIQHRFAYENCDLLGVSEDDEDHDSADSVAFSPAAGQKRKKTNHRGKGGCIPNGEDFWSRVDVWFSDEIAKRDNDLTGTLWKLWVCSIFDFDKKLCLIIIGIYSRYVEETLRLDNQKFNPAFAQNSSPQVTTSSMASQQSTSSGVVPGTPTVTTNSSASQSPPSTAEVLMNALRGSSH